MAVIIFLLIAAVIIVIKIVSDKPITLWGGGEYTFNVTRLRYAQVLPLIKVGDRLKLWTKPNYSRIIINVRGYGFILEEGQLGLVPHEYVSVIQRHLLSDYPLYDAEIVNISEKSCTVKVKLLSRKEQDILNAGVKLAHELSEREERVKLTALFEKPYHANLKAKPLMVIFTLLKKDFKDFQNVKLIVMPKEFYLKNIYDH